MSADYYDLNTELVAPDGRHGFVTGVHLHDDGDHMYLLVFPYRRGYGREYTHERYYGHELHPAPHKPPVNKPAQPDQSVRDELLRLSRWQMDARLQAEAVHRLLTKAAVELYREGSVEEVLESICAADQAVLEILK